MIVYDGTYRLQPDSIRNSEPGIKLVCAWRIRIINLTAGQPSIRYLKPTIFIASQTGLATSLTSCAEAAGKKISLDFKLDINKLLWIEHIPFKSGQWHAAVFIPKTPFGPDINYHINWRPLRPDEENLIRRFGIKTPS